MDVPENAVKITDPDTVKSLVVAQGHIQLIERVCSSCVDSHKLIYYRRFTPMPASFDLYNNLMDDWFNTDNVLDVDFALYSTYVDAIHDWDRWTFCNYNDPTVGFPRDCGPEGYVANNWNGSHGSGRGRPDYAFFIMPPIGSGPNPTLPPALSPSTGEWECDETVNFIENARYDQISLTDSCGDDGCDRNPVYASDGMTNNIKEAVNYCKDKCENKIIAPCAGFFFQKHTNGHEICGFYKTLEIMNSGTKVWHGHQQDSQICELNSTPNL